MLRPHLPTEPSLSSHIDMPTMERQSSHSSAGSTGADTNGTGRSSPRGLRLLPPAPTPPEMNTEAYRAFLSASPDDDGGDDRRQHGAAANDARPLPPPPPQQPLPPQSIPEQTRSFDDSVDSSISSNTYTHLPTGFPTSGSAGVGGFPTMSVQTIETSTEAMDQGGGMAQQPLQQQRPLEAQMRAMFRGYNPSASSTTMLPSPSPARDSAGSMGRWTPGSVGGPHAPLSELDTVYEIDGVVSRDDSTAASSERSPSTAAAAAAARRPLLPAGGTISTDGAVSPMAATEMDASFDTVQMSNVAGSGGTRSDDRGAGGRDRSIGGDDDSAIALLHSFGGSPLQSIADGGGSPPSLPSADASHSGGGGRSPDNPAWPVAGPPQRRFGPASDEGSGGGRRRPTPPPPAAPLVLGRFEVDDGDPLRYSDEEAFLRATDHIRAEGRARRVVLKLTDDPVGASAELTSRRGIDPRSVLPVLGALADWEAPELDYEGPIETERRDGLAREVRKCLASRVNGPSSHSSLSTSPSGSRSGSISGSTDEDTAADDGASPTFRYVLVLEHYDCTLEDVFLHGMVDLALARRVIKDVVLGLILLHTETIMHGDVQPRGIVHVGTGWKLADLQSSRRFGQQTMTATTPNPTGANGAGQRNWAYRPPEAAAALFDQSTTGEREQPQSPRSRCAADAARDLWSLGCVLYRLVLGRPLWNADRRGNISSADLKELAGWSPRSLVRRVLDWCHHRPGKEESEEGCEDVRPALDLIAKLLAPTPEDRRSNFEFGIVSVHQHEFLAGRPLERASLDLYESRRDVLRRDEEEHGRYLRVTSRLGLDGTWELRRVRDVLLLGAFEPTEARVPTSFVVLRGRLRRRPPDTASASASSAWQREATERALGEGMDWVDRFEALEPSVRGALDGDISSIGHFWGKISGMFCGDYMYLYFVDELTGEPVVLDDDDDDDDGRFRDQYSYPIEITTWSDVVPKLLPLMHLTMRAMALYHGVAGIARMFGAPPLVDVGAFPEDLRAGTQARVDGLKSERGDTAASPFGPIADDVVRLEAYKEQFLKGDESVRCKSLRELVRFLEKKVGGTRGSDDDAASFAGLNRYPDENGRAIWTTLADPFHVKEAIKKRSEERLKEAVHQWVDGRQYELDALQRNLRREREKAARRESELENARMELGESRSLADSLQSKVVELEIALGNARQELMRINHDLEDERSVVSKSSSSMFKLKKKKKEVSTPE